VKNAPALESRIQHHLALRRLMLAASGGAAEEMA
jgi:hypothetical protein